MRIQRQNEPAKLHRRVYLSTAGWLLVMAVSFGVPAPAAENGEAFFSEYVEPLLRERCFECHSHEYEEASGGLVLDSRSGWSVGGDSGPAVVPGDPAKSLLARAVRHELDGLQMPPDGRLTAAEIGLIERWIEEGAADPRSDGPAVEKRAIDLEAGREHWAFRPLPRVASGAGENWGEGQIADPYLDRRLAEAGIESAPPAGPAVWLRRVHYDLTGLPPTPEEVSEFLRQAETNPSWSARVDREARAALVDRLLASPQFGEKWGRHWLDLARYADSNGSSFNPPFKQAWKYRNWVIDAFNRGVPIDRFMRKQIAGDLLPYGSQAERDENLIATGFLMLGSKVLGTFDKEQLTLDVVDEQIDTIGKSMLGMTVACARCHDHKFDPIPQADYYAMAGILSSTVTLHDRLGGPKEDESDWSRRGLGEGGDERLQQFLKENGYGWIKATQKAFQARRKVSELESQIETSAPEGRETLRQQLASERETLAEWEAKLGQFEAEMPDYAMAVRDRPSPRDENLRIRGVAGNHGEVVPRGFLQVVSPADARPDLDERASGRRELADWITSPDNPLTPRVFVNRVWKHLFREGLVRSVDNFGTTGESPSHPELLDQLAARFVHSGWKLKPLVRELVMSDAYARAVTPSPPADPENRLLSHQNRRRLEPEELRDTLLDLAGRLDRTPAQGMIDHLPIGDVSNLGEAIRVSDDRRTIYQPVIRTLESTVLQVFDAPVNTMTTGSRAKTVVASQALYFLNSGAVIETSRQLAERLDGHHELAGRPAAEFRQVVEVVFGTIVGRNPTVDEARVLEKYLAAQADGEPGLTCHDLTKLCQAILSSTQFQFLD